MSSRKVFTSARRVLWLVIFCAVSLLVLANKKADATSPNLINFQGKVVNADGTNVTNGTYNFDFVLYDDASLGTPSDGVHDKWHELTKSVTITNGVFQTNLGSATALPNFNTNNSLYLAIKFNADAAGYMSPRVQLTSAPYALNADNLGGLASSAFGQISVANAWTNTNSVTTTSTTAFQVKNSSGQILTVDTSGNQVILGKPGASGITGLLVFDNATNANTAALTSGTTSSSYTLTLPTTLPGSTQCMASSNTGALSFTSCGGGGTLASTYSGGASQTDSTITLDSTRLGLIIKDAVTPVTGSLLIVQNNGGTSKFLDIRATGLDILGAGASSLTTSSAALTITSNQAATWSTTNGNLTVQAGSGTVSLGTSTVLTAAAGITIVPTTTSALNLATTNTGNVAIGNSTGTFALTSSGGLNVSTTGALTGVASVDTIAHSASAITFAGAGTLGTTGANTLTLSTGGASGVLVSPGTNNASAFAVQNTSGNKVINIDTTGSNQNNLITTLTANGTASFEATSTTGWAGAGGCTLSVVTSATTQPFNGLYSGQCSNTATAGAEFQYVTGALTTSTIYTFNFYAKVSATAGAFLNFGHRENGGAEDAAGLSLTNQNVLSNGWTRYSLTFKTGATLAAGDYLYIKQSDATARSLWIDGVTLQTDPNAESNFREGKIETGGIIDSALVLQNASNSSTAFQVQNALGANVFTVSTLDTNLVPNPGAEVNSSGWSAKGSGTIIRDTTQQKFGVASFKIVTTAITADGAQYAGLNLPIGTYSASLSIKNSGAAFGAGKLEVGITNSGGDNACVLSPATSATIPSTSGWTRFTCTVTIATTVGTAFYIKQTEAVAHTFWVDGIELDSGSTLTPYGVGGLSFNAVINTPMYLQNQSDSNVALQIVNASNTNTLLVADTLNSSVAINQSVAAPVAQALLVTTAATSTPSNGLVRFNFSGVRTAAGAALQIDDVSTTSATTLQVNANSLTTGNGLVVSATATGLTGNALSVTTGSTGVPSTGLVYFNFNGIRTAAGTAFRVTDISTTLATVMTITANSLTTGNGLAISGTALTTGSLLSLTAGAATVTTGNTLSVTNGRSVFTPTMTVASAAGAVWNGISIPATTATVTGTTAITTATGFNLINIAQPTITDASAVTITNAATLFVAGAPVVGGSVTITNSAGIWNNGLTRTGLGGTASAVGVCSSLAAATAPTASTAYELRDCNATPTADYAERYPVENGISYGDVVAVGTQMINTYGTTDTLGPDWNNVIGQVTKLIKSAQAYQANVIGIVSNNTGVFSSTGNNIKSSDNPMPVALAGRILVKISATSAPIAVGDYLTTSTNSGKAMKANKAGIVIGKALEAWDPAAGKDKIMVFVEQGYYPGPDLQTIQGSGTQSLNVAGLAPSNLPANNGVFSSQLAINTIAPATGTDITLVPGANGKVLLKDQNGSIRITLGNDGSASFTLGLDVSGLLKANNGIQVNGAAEFASTVEFQKLVSFLDKVSFQSDVSFLGRPTFNNDSGGFAVIKAQQQSVDIKYDKPYDDPPVITLNIRNGQFANYSYQYLKDKDQKIVGFTILLQKPATSDVEFAWTTLNIKDAKTAITPNN